LVIVDIGDDESPDLFLRVAKNRAGKAHGPVSKASKKRDPGIPVRFIGESFRFEER
jgi:hypothetical protein